MLKTEIKVLGNILKEYYQEAVVLGVAMLCIILYSHHPLGDRWLNQLFYYSAVPLVSIIVLLRKNPLDFGLRPGNYRLWFVYIGVAVVLIIPVLIYSAHDESMRQYYARRNVDLGGYVLKMAVILFAWEFFFRGFMLFGLKDRFKEGSIFVQTVPFVLLHTGKPEVEVLSCIITGVLFGFIAYRSGSFWPAYIIHFILNVSNRVMMSWLVSGG